MKRFFILDEREVWHAAAIAAAQRHGYQAQRIHYGSEAVGPGVGFIRPHADWRRLPGNREDYRVMAERLTMIQDAAQVAVYEDKSAQFARWGAWMPDTWRFTDLDAALAFIVGADFPLVSKADVGASSINVRILESQDDAALHLQRLFGAGVSVHHGADCPRTMQKGYALLQRFIPHKVTWRVNAIGDARAIFKRYCYPDRPVAQTGNVEPVMALDDETESLLEFCDRWFAAAGTKWCAVDVLKDGDGWRLLESSLAFPYPSPGRCNDGTIFRGIDGRRWIDLFDVMFDELEQGAWA